MSDCLKVKKSKSYYHWFGGIKLPQMFTFISNQKIKLFM